MVFSGFSRETLLGGTAAVGAALAVGFLAGRRYRGSDLFAFGTSGHSCSFLQGTGNLHKYVLDHSVREHPLLKKLRLAATSTPGKKLWISSDQAQLVANLIRLVGAKKVIEIGVSAGYNTLSMALVLPEDGRIVACEINEDLTSIGKPVWKEAGVLRKIDLRIKPAIETLEELLANGEAGTFDLAFIHADKESYNDYYEKCLRLIKKGKILVLDNVLVSGKVLKPGKNDRAARHIHQLNEKIFHDPRVNITMILMGNGITLGFKL
ncbi:catechol O-methyltransferase domain-containing protein 1 [Ahaetulla prasina]|uniref:catechol O-methyltransferase domain-containing protein 1 n=1 Tax=Ahaetulla prasina TaxID=499056 RepID=UPI0026478F67|nr:catechol O-methyltransferase domain-containing protein 1 [Ahaetulla prasina]